MARVIVTIQIMPDGPDSDLKKIEKDVLQAIKKFAGEGETKTEIEPIAFGLSALKVIFIMDEQLGSTEPLEADIAKKEGITSVMVVDVRRTIG